MKDKHNNNRNKIQFQLFYIFIIGNENIYLECFKLQAINKLRRSVKNRTLAITRTYLDHSQKRQKKQNVHVKTMKKNNLRKKDYNIFQENYKSSGIYKTKIHDTNYFNTHQI